MASKKQRRRREKLQRHEYEYVIENEEGEEVPVESPRAAARTPAAGSRQPKLVDRRGREIKPPSWERTFKRGLIFGPILLVLVFITGRSLSTGAKILNAVILLAIFLPFSYLVDMFVYRSLMKRHRRSGGG